MASSGVASDYLVTLEVTGHKSGRMISLPVVIAIVDGQRSLVSMLGDNAMGPRRVQNVREAGGRDKCSGVAAPTPFSGVTT